MASGKAQLVFQQMPLEMHPFAVGAAVAAECAGRQGKFWEMHDAMFADQKSLDAAALHASATKLKLNMKSFDACVADDTVATSLKASAQRAKDLSVSGTPTFFVGTMQADGRVKVTQRSLRELRDERPFTSAVDALTSGSSAANSGKRDNRHSTRSGQCERSDDCHCGFVS